MDRLSTLTSPHALADPGSTRDRGLDVRVPAPGPVLAPHQGADEAGATEASASEPPVRFPMDDLERNLIDLLEHDLVVED